MNVGVRIRFILPAAAIVAAMLGPDRVAAQATSITGTVTDSATRLPVPGVQILVVGTTRGAVTDSAGRYQLGNVSAGPHIVRAQRIGYARADARVTLTPGVAQTADFNLSPVATALSEVVVTGYGTALRADVSAAISTVSGAELQGAPVAGLDLALQGKAPGVQVIQNAGNPGVGITIRVRGSASLSASNQPLYVIDGVPMLREDYSQLAVGGQDITAVTGISPDEIESINILKDAASAAIYGSRASNGVVMITTKRGRVGRPRFTFNAYSGVQDVAKKLELTNSREFVEFINQARANDGLSPRFTPGVDDQTDTDWQEEVLRNANVSDAFLSVDGGNERIRYLVSGSYFNQKGIVIGSGYDRQSTRVNLDFNATERVSFRSSLSLSREMHDRVTGDDTIEGVFANAIADQPMFPVRQSDGRFTDPTDRVNTTALGYINPVAVGTLNFRESRSLRSVGNVEATVLLTDRLRLTGRAGLDVLNLRDLRWDSPRVVGSTADDVRGVSVQGNNTAKKYVLESFAGYEQGFSAGQLGLTAGASVEYNDEEWERLRGEGFAHTDFQYPGNASGVTEWAGDQTAYNLVSFFSRANVSLRDKYLLTASIRSDGSSRFGEQDRYGVFPAISAGWHLSREPFMQALGNVADFKLRVSYGETGNQDIGDDFAPIERYAEARFAGEPGIAPENIGNPELRWESTREYDIGFDLGMFDNRLTFIADYYVKKTNDLLVERPVTTTTGFASIWDNVGNIENRGIELGVTTVNFEPASAGGFRWATDVNISWNRNKVTHLFAGQAFNRGFDGINRFEVGQPMGAFYMVRFLGVDPETGDALFLDVDGDGETGDDADDREVVGSPHPNYWGGLTNTISWKGFDLRGFVQFSQGGEIVNFQRAYNDDGGVSRFDNKLKHVMSYWRQPGDITDVPRPSVSCAYGACLTSTRWMEDASYVRLQEVTLSYRIPARIGGTNLQDARLFVTGRNLHTWTDYKTGFNPEGNSAGSSSNTTLATEFYSYPLARTISVGVSGSW